MRRAAQAKFRRRKWEAVEPILGLSMTSSKVGWVVLDGSGVDAATLDHDVFDLAGGSADDDDISKQVAAVRGVQAIAAAGGQDLRSIGVTWTADATATAFQMLSSLPDLGFDTVVMARLAEATMPSNDALLTLARGAALAVMSNAETVEAPPPHQRPVAEVAMKKQSWFSSPARAAVLVAGVTALFVVGPELGRQPESPATEIQPASGSSANSVSVQAIPAPCSGTAGRRTRPAGRGASRTGAVCARIARHRRACGCFAGTGTAGTDNRHRTAGTGTRSRCGAVSRGCAAARGRRSRAATGPRLTATRGSSNTIADGSARCGARTVADGSARCGACTTSARPRSDRAQPAVGRSPVIRL